MKTRKQHSKKDCTDFSVAQKKNVNESSCDNLVLKIKAEIYQEIGFLKEQIEGLKKKVVEQDS